MKIGIHHTPGSFSERWIKYCELNKIDFKLVDCYQNDIIQQLKDCDAFMWHHHHLNYKDLLFAKQLLYSLESAGKRVFPNFNSNWHFDDKIGQKYLFEAFNIPHVPTNIFYSKQDALKWIEKANFPQIFKMRCGAGSLNVSLIYSKKVAINKINLAFGKGFLLFDRIGYLKEIIRRYRAGKEKLLNVFKALVRLVIQSDNTKMLKNEKGYVYFQEFIFSKGFDIRIVVIGDKAFAIKRMVRRNDFRASGSGDIIYNIDEIPIEAIKLAFEITNKIQANCITYDIVFNAKDEPLILEVSFGFAMLAYDECPGYWDRNLEIHLGQFNPQSWMVDLVK
jgi:glutathione synthase/RimK-type ligase-like ATP-grasp enzyme